jgi:uncharacterized protein
MENTASIVNWFKIVVSDIDKATKFYGTILVIKLNLLEAPVYKMVLFPVDSLKGIP